MTTTADDVLFEDYLANRLDAAGVVRLKQVLASDRAARARFVAVLQEWELLAESARQITGASCPVLDDSANRAIGARRRSVVRVAAARPTTRRTLGLLVPMGALAATLLVALWATRPGGDIAPAGNLSVAGAGVSVLRGAQTLPAKPGTVLLSGDHVRVGDGAHARIDFADTTTLALDSRTDVKLLTDGMATSGKRIDLMWGRVTAAVAKQPSGRPMVFTTPNARAVVLGTTLSLEFNADAAATRLDVSEGLVGISEIGGRTLVEVPAGHFATVAENTRTVARPVATPPATVRKTYRPGLRATYFAGTAFQEQIFERVEPNVHVDLGLQSTPLEQRRTDFSVRWQGYLQPRFSEKHLLTLRADAGARVYVDDKLVIDAWTSERIGDHQGSVMLDANRRHTLRVEYRQPKAGMLAKLDWVSPSQRPETIPQERLSTDQ